MDTQKLRGFSLIFAAFLFSSCATTPNYGALRDAESLSEFSCSYRAFIEAAQCVQGSFDKSYPNWRADPNSDLVGMYIGWLGQTAQYVSNGQLPEDQARVLAAQLHHRLNEISYQRAVDQQQRQQRRIAIANAISQSAASMQAALPAPRPPPTVCTSVANRNVVTSVCQ